VAASDMARGKNIPGLPNSPTLAGKAYLTKQSTRSPRDLAMEKDQSKLPRILKVSCQEARLDTKKHAADSEMSWERQADPDLDSQLKETNKKGDATKCSD